MTSLAWCPRNHVLWMVVYIFKPYRDNNGIIDDISFSFCPPARRNRFQSGANFGGNYRYVLRRQRYFTATSAVMFVRRNRTWSDMWKESIQITLRTLKANALIYMIFAEQQLIPPIIVWFIFDWFDCSELHLPWARKTPIIPIKNFIQGHPCLPREWWQEKWSGISEYKFSLPYMKMHRRKYISISFSSWLYTSLLEMWLKSHWVEGSCTAQVMPAQSHTPNGSRYSYHIWIISQ
jgi:hypothetical protein